MLVMIEADIWFDARIEEGLKEISHHLQRILEKNSSRVDYNLQI